MKLIRITFALVLILLISACTVPSDDDYTLKSDDPDQQEVVIDETETYDEEEDLEDSLDELERELDELENSLPDFNKTDLE